MKVIGFHNTSYSFDDGRSASGITLYLSDQIDDPSGAGVRTEKAFLSNNKLKGYFPSLGDEVIIDRAQSGSVRGLYCITKSGK